MLTQEDLQKLRRSFKNVYSRNPMPYACLNENASHLQSPLLLDLYPFASAAFDSISTLAFM